MNVLFFSDWEVTPLFYMLKLAPGDQVVIEAFDQANGAWTQPSNVKTGPATSFTLRYLGAHVAHLQSTTAVPVDTTPLFNGPFFPWGG